VVILSVSSVWKAPYELYAHATAARDAGFSDRCVAALLAGARHRELAADEEIAERLSLVLTAGHAIGSTPTRWRSSARKGLVDLVLLAGCYHLVCGMLNVFDIPSPKTDADHLSQGV